MTVLENSGSRDFDTVGGPNAIPLQLYNNTNFIATILFFKYVCSILGVRIKMGTEIDGCCYVQPSAGQVLKSLSVLKVCTTLIQTR